MFMDRKTQLYIVKMSFLPNLIYRFNAIPIKISTSYIVDIDKLILKFIWRSKRPRIAKKIFKNKIGLLILSNFKINYKVTVSMPVWYWPRIGK